MKLEEFMMHKSWIIASPKPFHLLFASIWQEKIHNNFTLMLDGPSSQACTLSLVMWDTTKQQSWLSNMMNEYYSFY
jgi:hypothetical protein